MPSKKRTRSPRKDVVVPRAGITRKRQGATARVQIPRFRVEAWRLKNWQTAARMLEAQPGRAGLAFSAFVKAVLDDAAEEVFLALGPPKERDLYPEGVGGEGVNSEIVRSGSKGLTAPPQGPQTEFGFGEGDSQGSEGASEVPAAEAPQVPDPGSGELGEY